MRLKQVIESFSTKATTELDESRIAFAGTKPLTTSNILQYNFERKLSPIQWERLPLPIKKIHENKNCYFHMLRHHL